MTVTADAERRVTLPKEANPGDTFDVEVAGDGHFLLRRVAIPERQVTISEENGFLVASSGRPITMAETRAAMDEFP